MLGCLLWIIFFADVEGVVRGVGASPDIFADDLNAVITFPVKTSSAQVFQCLEAVQEAVHGWDAHNQVRFDPAKESMAIIHHKNGIGEVFRLLGVHYDVKLTMCDAINAIVQKAGGKLKSLLRTAH